MKTVFLDLDGTLTDPAEGIFASFNHALTRLGRPPLDAARMGWVIGPPLIDSFTRLGVADPQEAVRLYREAYADHGIFQCLLYPGIPAALEAMQRQGLRLILMTAKPHVFAKRITAHFGIARYLDAEYGPELDGTHNDKAELLAHALTLEPADPAQAIMVGDRLNDIRAARCNDMASLGVGWGYGTEDELLQATARCGAISELPAVVNDLLNATP